MFRQWHLCRDRWHRHEADGSLVADRPRRCGWVILGVLTFRSPDTTALVLLTFIAAWSIVSGIFEIATALQLRKLIVNEWLMILSGVVSIIFGILLIAQPGAGAIAIVWLLGAYALLFGILTLMFAFRLRGMRNTIGRQATGAL